MIDVIMSMLMVTLAAVVAGACDRIRGSEAHSYIRLGALAVYSMCIAYTLGLPVTGFWGIVIFLLWVAGERPGWGVPIGNILYPSADDHLKERHWWQVGVLSTNDWLAITARGVIWGLPLAALAVLYNIDSSFIKVLLVPIAMGLAFPLSLYAAWSRALDATWTKWEWAELIRGTLFIYILCGLDILVGMISW